MLLSNGEVTTLLDLIAEGARQSDIEVTFEKDEARVTLDGRILRTPYRVLDSNTARNLDRNDTATERRVLYCLERATQSKAEEFRRRGWWFMDSSGNMFIKAPGVLVDIRGRRARTAEHAMRSLPQTYQKMPPSSNLMSARRSQVVFCLLTWPELVNAPTRYVAEISGVSNGLVHSVFESLRRLDFLIPDVGLLRVDELADQWASAFSLGLAPSIELGRFAGDPILPHSRDLGMFISGEQAALGLKGAQSAVFYANHLETKIILTSRWRPATGDANIVVRRKFWSEPSRSQTHLFTSGDMAVVPPLLIYADLLDSKEPRQREVAKQMRGFASWTA